jgi:hypothetical protein
MNLICKTKRRSQGDAKSGPFDRHFQDISFNNLPSWDKASFQIISASKGGK